MHIVYQMKEDRVSTVEDTVASFFNFGWDWGIINPLFHTLVIQVLLHGSEVILPKFLHSKTTTTYEIMLAQTSLCLMSWRQEKADFILPKGERNG